MDKNDELLKKQCKNGKELYFPISLAQKPISIAVWVGRIKVVSPDAVWGLDINLGKVGG